MLSTWCCLLPVQGCFYNFLLLILELYYRFNMKEFQIKSTEGKRNKEEEKGEGMVYFIDFNFCWFYYCFNNLHAK